MRKKQYGSYKTDICIVCGAQAFKTNAQGLPTCKRHMETDMPNLRCLCGDPVEIRTGKYGAYAFCMRCGNKNLKKILEMNPEQAQSRAEQRVPSKEPDEKRKKEYEYGIFLD